VSWSEPERQRAATILAEIDSWAAPRRLTERIRGVRLAVSEMNGLCNGIWGSFPVTFVRHLYRALGFDEHRVFKWRLEHKLIQALVLNHYAPGCIPLTRGLHEFKRRAGNKDLRPALEAEFPSGFYLKPALGDSSGDCEAPNRNERILDACAEQSLAGDPGELLSETFIAQELIPIAVEYRVHTLEDRVIDDLTFHRYGKGDIPGERDAPNAFVQSVLDRLPNAIVAGTICGWDVARTPRSGLLVIEVNFSGFHPVHNRGFQCSGWFHDEDWGALSTARLVRFLEDRCGVRISIAADRPDLEIANRCYAEISRYLDLLRSGSFT
jgi:hypothetical protein